jgi:hypothetical protein
MANLSKKLNYGMRWLSSNILYFVFPIIFILILYGDYLQISNTYIGSWYDLLSNSLYYTAIDNNYFATWNNLWSGGFPLIASPNSDKYYPLSFPFYLLTQNLDIVNIILLIHLLIAYFGFFKLGSLITKNKNALLIFSTFFTFSGALLVRVYAGHHILLYGLVWIPLLYYLFFNLTLFNKCTLKNTIYFSIVLSLIYFTGDIYHFVLSGVILLIFVLYYIITKQISGQVLKYLVLAAVLTLLVISIKLIPDIGVSDSIIRSTFEVSSTPYLVNPAAGGGGIEKSLSSFIFGTGIDSWGYWESSVMIGIIPILLMVFALIYGRHEITVPSFFALIFSLIYAAGETTALSFIHYFPVLDVFRCPGRIFGAIIPIILFLALYGMVLLYTAIKNNKSLLLTAEQKKYVIIGLAITGIVKIFELPYQGLLAPSSAISVIIICEFILLLFIQKGTVRNILLFLNIADLITLLILLVIYPGAVLDLVKLGLLSLALIVILGAILKNNINNNNCKIFCGMMVSAVCVMMVGNLCMGDVAGFNPQFNKSSAPEVISIVKSNVTDSAQIWVYENGFYFFHYDFTYWDIMNGIHPIATYGSYVLKTAPSLNYTVGNITYSTVDYIVDTQYLENNNQNLPESSFKVNNISVYYPKPVLPNAFYIRNGQVYSLAISNYSSDNVIANGEMVAGDTVVLKNAYYPGWKVNGVNAQPINNMTGTILTSETKQVQFTFDPIDYKVGVIMTVSGILLVITGLLVSTRKRRDIK